MRFRFKLSPAYSKRNGTLISKLLCETRTFSSWVDSGSSTPTEHDRDHASTRHTHRPKRGTLVHSPTRNRTCSSFAQPAKTTTLGSRGSDRVPCEQDVRAPTPLATIRHATRRAPRSMT